MRFLNQPCGPCSWCRTSRRPSTRLIASGSPETSDTSILATASSWVTMSNRPRTMPSLSERTPSTSMVCGPVTVQLFSVMVPPGGRHFLRIIAIYRDYEVTIYRRIGTVKIYREIPGGAVAGRPTPGRRFPATGTSRGAARARPSARSRPGRGYRRWRRGPGATARGSAAGRTCRRRGVCAVW